MTCRRRRKYWHGRGHSHRWWSRRSTPVSGRPPLVATVDRAAGTATVAGVAYRLRDHGGGERDVYELRGGRRVWLGAFCPCHGIYPRDGGRTSQRRRRWETLAAVARAWQASESEVRDGR